jgi:hypothetical protein
VPGNTSPSVQVQSSCGSPGPATTLRHSTLMDKHFGNAVTFTRPFARSSSASTLSFGGSTTTILPFRSGLACSPDTRALRPTNALSLSTLAAMAVCRTITARPHKGRPAPNGMDSFPSPCVRVSYAYVGLRGARSDPLRPSHTKALCNTGDSPAQRRRQAVVGTPASGSCQVNVSPAFCFAHLQHAGS